MNLGLPWHIAGVVESGKLSHLFAPLDSLQEKYSAKGKVSVIYVKLDDPRLALDHYGEAEKIFERLAKEHPGRAEYRHDEARARIDRAIVLHVLWQFDEAEKEHDRAVALLTDLARAAENVPEYRSDLNAQARWEHLRCMARRAIEHGFNSEKELYLYANAHGFVGEQTLLEDDEFIDALKPRSNATSTERAKAVAYKAQRRILP